MTMRITMTQTRMGESGSLLTSGSTYTVSDAFGAAMVGAGYATDTDAALTPPESQPLRLSADGTAVVSGDGALVRRSAFGNVGRRIFHGRQGNFDNTVSNTFHAVFEIPCDFDGARAILVNSATSTYAISTNVAFCVLDSAADLNGSSQSDWVDLATTTGTVPASAATNRRAYLKSDIAAISNAGKATRLLAVRVRITTSSTVSIMGNGTDSFTNWASRTDGQLVCFRNKAGTYNSAATASGFDSVTNISQSPICGVEVMCRGKVLNIGTCDDSNGDGRGTYLGAGYGLATALLLQEELDLPVFYSNLSWPGQGMGNIRNNAIDAATYSVVPDLLYMPGGSINDYTADTITAAMVAISRFGVGRAIGELSASTRPPRIVLRNVASVNPAVSSHNHDATDSLRIAWNAEVAAAYGAEGYPIFDCATLTNGAVDGGGQMVPNATYVPDGIHFGDDGIALIAPVAVAAGLVALGAY